MGKMKKEPNASKPLTISQRHKTKKKLDQMTKVLIVIRGEWQCKHWLFISKRQTETAITFNLYFLESIPIISIKLDNPWPNILGKWLRKYRIFPKFCGKCSNYTNVTNLLNKEIHAQVQQYKPLNLEKDKKYVQSYQ